MKVNSWNLVKVVVFLWLLWIPNMEGQVINPQAMPARVLDLTLQAYAYRAFVNPVTDGIPYDGVPPSEFSGIEISAMRLRSESLYERGVETFKEFRIPGGSRERPFVERLVLVYHNFLNWSSRYYSLSGYVHLAPVLGLLAYNGSDVSAADLPELYFSASKEAIMIEFGEVNPVPPGSVAKCASYDFHGLVTFTDVVNSSLCLTTDQGHFSIVASSAVTPAKKTPASIKKEKYDLFWRGIRGIAVLIVTFLSWVVLCVWKCYWCRRNRDTGRVEILNTYRVQMARMRENI